MPGPPDTSDAAPISAVTFRAGRTWRAPRARIQVRGLDQMVIESGGAPAPKILLLT